MNKTVSINISGFAFIIDEMAFQQLQQYLNTIRSYFTLADGVDEIMTDIEIRVAEIFRERLDNKREVIDQSDVDHVITILGQPEAFIDEEATDNATNQSADSKKRRSRRVFRDPDHTTIGGVASGIAAYFGVDRVWIRLLFVILTLGGLAGIPIYIILWIILPEAKTAADKLEMRGEPVTVENIGRIVNESIESVKKNVGGLADSKKAAEVGNQAKNGIAEVFVFIGKMLLLLMRAVVKIFAVLLILIGVTLAIVLVASMIGYAHFNVMHIGDHSYPISEVFGFSQLVMDSQYLGWWFTIAVISSIAIPLIALLYTGIRMLFNLRHRIKGLGIGLTVLWFIAIITLVITGLRTGKDFSIKSEFSEITPLKQVTSDTLYLSVMKDPYFSDHLYPGTGLPLMDWTHIESGTIYLGNPKVNVVENVKDSLYEIAVLYAARGASQNEAVQNAENIRYRYEQNNNRIAFQPYFNFPEVDKFRGQQVYVEVRVPIGKAVHFSNNLDRVIYDVQNTTHTYDRDMVGETWTMLSEGLTCLGCKRDKIKSKRRKNR